MNYYPTYKEFLGLANKGNVIPVYKEINADMDTPVSAYLKTKNGDYAFLLESVEGQEKLARYSFLGSAPSLVFQSKGRLVRITDLKRKKITSLTAAGSPLDEVKKIMRPFRPVRVKGLPRFWGGLVGYIGYDMVRFFEKIPDKNKDDLGLPDCLLMLTDTILIFDHIKHTVLIVKNIILDEKKSGQAALKKAYLAAIREIESIEKDFRKPTTGIAEDVKAPSGCKVSSNFSRQEFCAAVVRAKEYIRKGDIIQAVLSQRFQLSSRKGPMQIYRRLRSLNPSPYMYLLQFKGASIVGSSPEMLVRCEDGMIQTRPIAGTRRRGRDEVEDNALAQELAQDAKEKAEHIMLVDLGRNDLGRVSRPGSVKVAEFMNIERYSHVMHLVSEVKGILDKGRFDIYDCLKSAFPAGTVSGSPKIRAMEIIEELENLRRGPYAGCVGYFSFSHNLDTCITIRTLLLKGGKCYIQAGAGIVADSVPEREYQETVNKAKALIEAVSK